MKWANFQEQIFNEFYSLSNKNASTFQLQINKRRWFWFTSLHLSLKFCFFSYFFPFKPAAQCLHSSNIIVPNKKKILSCSHFSATSGVWFMTIHFYIRAASKLYHLAQCGFSQRTFKTSHRIYLTRHLLRDTY